MPRQTRVRPIEVLSSEEVRRMIDMASDRYTSGIRLRALIGVMFGCGLRLAETLALQPRDISWRQREINVRRGKGGKQRRVGMPPETHRLLERWMRRRDTYALPTGAPVFCTYGGASVGNELCQQYVRTALNRLAKRAGISKRVHPHGLRHSFAFDLAQEATPMHVIKTALGHSSLQVTDIYVSHLGSKDVLDTMRQREW